MPILVILILTAACMPADWPNPLHLSLRESAGWTGAAVLAPLLAAFMVRSWAIRSLHRNPDGKGTVGEKYDRLRRVLFFVNVGSVAFAVLGLGWGAAVWHSLTISWHGLELLAPFAELIVPLPY